MSVRDVDEGGVGKDEHDNVALDPRSDLKQNSSSERSPARRQTHLKECLTDGSIHLNQKYYEATWRSTNGRPPIKGKNMDILERKTTIQVSPIHTDRIWFGALILGQEIFAVEIGKLTFCFLQKIKWYIFSEQIRRYTNLKPRKEINKTSPKIGPSRCARFVFAILCNTL